MWHLTLLTIGGDGEPPSKVTGLTVTDAKDGKLNLAWSAATDNVLVDHYKIYRDNPFLTTCTNTFYQDTGLTNGHSYTYRVSAVDSFGNEGETSNPVSGTPTASATPPPQPPPSGPSGPSGPFGPIGDTNLPPKADANGPYYSFIGNPITFDGSSSNDSDGNITSYAWIFGDGRTNGTGKIVTHTYDKVGNYTVKLTVTDDDGKTNEDTTYAVITGKPNYPPTANFSYSPLNPTTDDTIQFTDLSIDTDGTIVSYLWNFSDGTNSTDKNPNHKYSKSGAYMITLKITDDANATDILSETILVEESNKGTTGTTTEKPKGTPGFELILVICAITLVLLWKRKRAK
jgi:PKD repeat protein